MRLSTFAFLHPIEEGQLQTFRDARVAFPCYDAKAGESPSLCALGPLTMPKRRG